MGLLIRDTIVILSGAVRLALLYWESRSGSCIYMLVMGELCKLSSLFGSVGVFIIFQYIQYIADSALLTCGSAQGTIGQTICLGINQAQVHARQVCYPLYYLFSLLAWILKRHL